MKSKVCIVIETYEGKIFGCYIDIIIDKVRKDMKDENAFVFNLESNGRHKSPIKFDILKEECDTAFWLFPDDYDGLFRCGNVEILIYKENRKSSSYCRQYENSRFDYRGVEKALVENPHPNGKDFTPKRIIVIQMN